MKPMLIPLLMALFLMNSANASPVEKTPADSRNSYSIRVDKNGTMRRSDNNQEVSYFGTNYTLPFAYSYRFAKRNGLDIKKCIDNDVYHMKRLGFNGFRIHLWDVELTDSLGNLLQNDHLDYLDYMIAALEREGIDVILTAQTNFGNGYPEKDINTGAYSYLYPKCGIHEDPKAQKAQEKYLTQLVEHRNPYTQKSYADDKAIIAVEINNEPCHGNDPKAVTEYINRMTKALRRGGFDRIVLYNVSHNPDVTQAYYNADIQGTTYQWYPTGLIAGHQRKGNFLPYISSYEIPWRNNIKNFDKMAKVVYEFDAGDVADSYLYPVIARAFRNAGFQWATHFAYDPTPIAPFNTEYQTHFLNLLYTPGKAVGIAIAAEAMRSLPRGNGSTVAAPTDTVFGDITVSHSKDLAILNTEDKYYHTASSSIPPKSPDSLRHIIGVGNSPLVSYQGNGIYFLDKEGDNWRLEVMPDVIRFKDPFSNRTEGDMVATLQYNPHLISLNLPNLKEKISATIKPGLYTISTDGQLLPAQGRYAGNPQFATLQGETLIPLYTPSKFDNRVDLSLQSGRWQYDRQYRPASEWWNPKDQYEIEIPHDDNQTDTFTWRCYVADNTKTFEGTGYTGNLEINADLPADSEIAIVLKNGTSLSAKADDFSKNSGLVSIPLSRMTPTPTSLIPQAFPTFLPRQSQPSQSLESPDQANPKVSNPKVEEIEFVEIRFPVPSRSNDSSSSKSTSSKLVLKNISLQVLVSLPSGSQPGSV